MNTEKAVGLSQNQYVQASHQLLSLVEQSKSNLENIVDNLPNAFAIVSSSGTIFRGNDRLSKIFNLNIEYLIGKSIAGVFSKENWNIFQQHINHVTQDPDNRSIVTEFEIDVKMPDDLSCPFHWSLKRFEGGNSDTKDWIIVFGQDVSEIKAFQDKLSKIFSTIPLAIIQVNSNGEIIEPYSAYSEYLLGNKGFAGKKLFDVLFKPAWSGMSIPQKESANQVLNVIGYSDLQFELIKDNLPNQLFYPIADAATIGLEDNGRWLGLTFEPVMRSGMVDGLLIILEDKSAVIKANKMAEVKRSAEESTLQRFMEAKQHEPSMLEVLISDLDKFFKSMEKNLSGNEVVPVLKDLHGAKGTARIGGFSWLREMAHKLEDEFLNSTENTQNFNWKKHMHKFQPLFKEWKEVKTAAKFILLAEADDNEGNSKSQNGNSGKSSSEASIERVFARLNLVVQDACKRLNKDAKLDFQVSQIEMSPEFFADVSECFLHLVTNAMDHGLEPADVRVAEGKLPQGKITIVMNQNAKETVFDVIDDGRGIDPQKVSDAALKKGIISEQELSKMTPDQIRELIFRVGFSTAEKTTLMSGRGIGMDAVASLVKKHGGKITINSNVGQGTKFQFTFLSNKL